MREIRFRAWVIRSDAADKINMMRYEDNQTIFGWRGDGVTMEIMQFTGLKDKNGKEIYEGDIVTFLDGSYISTENGIDTNEFISTGVIEWCGERKGWDVTNREDVDTNECFDEYMEVIGNIYENPELLKK